MIKREKGENAHKNHQNITSNIRLQQQEPNKTCNEQRFVHCERHVKLFCFFLLNVGFFLQYVVVVVLSRCSDGLWFRWL